MNLDKMLKKVGLAFFIRGLGAVSIYLMYVLCARVMPVNEAGLFFLGTTLVTFMSNIGIIGLNNTILRFVAAYHAEGNWNKINAVVEKSLRWGVLALAFFSLAVFAGAGPSALYIFHKPDFAPVQRYMAPAIFFLGLNILISHQLQAIRKFERSIFVLAIGVPLGLSLGVWTLGVKTSFGASLVYSAAGLTTTVLGAIWWLRLRQKSDAKESFASHLLWASCWPLWISAIMGQTAQWSAQLVAGMWVSKEEIALLASAQRTSMLVSFILIAVNVVVAPRFAAMHQLGNTEELKRLARWSVKLMLIIAVPVTLGMLLFAEQIMALFGEKFVPGANILRILSLGQLVNVMTGSVGYLLNMCGYERDMRNIVICSGALALLMAVVLTYSMGVLGAALATAIAVSIQNLGANYMVRRRLGFNTMAFWR